MGKRFGIFLLAIVLVLPVNAQVGKYLTLVDDAPIVGPIESYTNKSEVYTEILQSILARAHEYAIDYYEPDSNENYSYYTFLVLALTTALHESRLQHFRYGTGDTCDDPVNSFEDMSSRVRGQFAAYYKDPDRLLAPLCSVFHETTEYPQVMVSGINFQDVGLLQINARWSRFISHPNNLLNLDRHVLFGIDRLYKKDGKGFAVVRSEHNKYSCLSENPFDQPLVDSSGKRFSPVRRYTDRNGNEYPTVPKIFHNMIRGTWAGHYNSWSGDVCRFTTTNGHDVRFNERLLKLVMFEDSLFHRHLSDISLAKLALTELIQNYRLIFVPKSIKEANGLVETRQFLGPFIENYKSPETKKMASSPTKDYILTHKVKLPFYSAPIKSNESLCGYLGSISMHNRDVKVSRVFDGENRQWAQVTLHLDDIALRNATDAFERQKQGRYTAELVSLKDTDTCLGTNEYYVYGDYVKPVQKTGLSAELREYKVIARTAPSYLSHSIVAYLFKNENLTYDVESVSKEGQSRWYQIRLPSDELAWVPERDVIVKTDSVLAEL